jgi:hypothetical protein
MPAVTLQPEDRRPVYAYCFMFDLTSQKISRVFEYPVKTVRWSPHCARKMLQKGFWPVAMADELTTRVEENFDEPPP